jgi:hypothetical protein
VELEKTILTIRSRPITGLEVSNVFKLDFSDTNGRLSTHTAHLILQAMAEFEFNQTVNG